jgi:ribose-phosphate pyrophosphokinase
MAVKLAVGPSSTSLGVSLAQKLGIETIGVTCRHFPDGETYVRLEEAAKGDELILVQSLCSPQAENLMILLQMASAARGLGVRNIVAVVPYMAYSRQDRKFLPGEALTAELIARNLETCGVSGIFIVEPHSEESLSFFSVPCHPVLPAEDTVEFLRNRGDCVVVAPDEKRLPDAKDLATRLSVDFGWIEKSRDLATGSVTAKIGSVPRTSPVAVLFDDMISSGGTIVKAAELLRSAGFERIEAGCVHGLFAHEAEQKMTEAGVSFIFASDTIESKFTRYSVAQSVAESVKKEFP